MKSSLRFCFLASVDLACRSAAFGGDDPATTPSASSSSHGLPDWLQKNTELMILISIVGVGAAMGIIMGVACGLFHGARLCMNGSRQCISATRRCVQGAPQRFDHVGTEESRLHPPLLP